MFLHLSPLGCSAAAPCLSPAGSWLHVPALHCCTLLRLCSQRVWKLQEPDRPKLWAMVLAAWDQGCYLGVNWSPSWIGGYCSILHTKAHHHLMLNTVALPQFLKHCLINVSREPSLNTHSPTSTWKTWLQSHSACSSSSINQESSNQSYWDNDDLFQC